MSSMAARNRIAEILLKAKLLDDLQLRAAQAQHEQWGGRLGKLVAELGFAQDDAIADAIAKALFLRRIQLGNLTKDATALSKLDADYAERCGVFPVGMRDNGKTILLAMADPTDLQVVDEVAMRARARVITVVAGEQEIKAAILRHYRGIEPDIEALQGRPRSRTGQQVQTSFAEEEGSSDDEFKIVDISGKTVMKAIKDIDPRLAQENAAAAADRSAPPVSTSSMLDEILESPKEEPGLSAELIERLEAVRTNQDKSSRILKAVFELLLEKGAVGRDELRARLKM